MQSCARSSDGSNLDLLDARARVCLDQQSQLVIHNNALAQVKYLYSMLPQSSRESSVAAATAAATDALGAPLRRSGSPWLYAAGHGVDELAQRSVTVIDAVLASVPSVSMQLSIAGGMAVPARMLRRP